MRPDSQTGMSRKLKVKKFNMKKIVPIAGFALLFIFFSGEAALACSCKNPPTVEQSFEQSAAVFYGTVESVEASGDKILARFKVEKSWKGADTDLVAVRTDQTSCGIDFKPGEKYYLFLDRAGDVYETVPCRRHAGAQEEFLNNKPPLALQKVSRSLIASGNLLPAAALITGLIILLAVSLSAVYVFKTKKR
jgi:hypothetical protein